MWREFLHKLFHLWDYSENQYKEEIRICKVCGAEEFLCWYDECEDIVDPHNQLETFTVRRYYWRRV